jgi:hypothetical protein
MTMAGSYEHIMRTTKPAENTAESYGGLDTSLVENMGDAIEAMVHMWWMIQLLANGNKALINAISHRAQMIEVGREEPPAEWGSADEDDSVPQKVPAWVETTGLRFVKKLVPLDGTPELAQWRTILQQRFVHTDSREEWRDVPLVSV